MIWKRCCTGKCSAHSSKLMIPARWTHFKGACLLSHSCDLLSFANFCLIFGGMKEHQCFLVACWRFVLYLSDERIKTYICDPLPITFGHFNHSVCCFNTQRPHVSLTGTLKCTSWLCQMCYYWILNGLKWMEWMHFLSTISVLKLPFLTRQMDSNCSGIKHFHAV